MKIYCENCKYHSFFRDDYMEVCYNKNNFTPMPNPIYEGNGIYSLCEKANKNNDCKYFKPNLFFKIKNFFKGGNHEIR